MPYGLGKNNRDRSYTELEDKSVLGPDWCGKPCRSVHSLGTATQSVTTAQYGARSMFGCSQFAPTTVQPSNHQEKMTSRRLRPPYRADKQKSVPSVEQAAAYLHVFPHLVENELLLGNLQSMQWAELKRFRRSLLARRRRALAKLRLL